jgi:hypothetical protein
LVIAMLTLLLAATLAFADDDIPPIYKTSPHFSNAIGTGTLTVTAAAEPTTLPLGDSLVYTFTVENVRNPAQVKRPTMETNAFAVEPLDSTVENQRVVFRFRLRPRSVEVKEIPSIRFDFYHPEANEEKRLRTKYTAAIPIVVTVKAETGALPGFTVPERFRTFVAERPVPWSPSLAARLGVPILMALSTTVWIFAWRRRNPQGARLVTLQRHRAVRRAVIAIQRAERGRVSSAEVMQAFQEYLRERFAAPSVATTPSELCQALSGKVSLEVLKPVEQLLRDGDAARFGGAGADSLANRTRDAILALEAAS